jgi:rhodanese-related sulfurtransferase
MKFRSLSPAPLVMILALAPIGVQAAEDTPKAIPGGVCVNTEQAKAQFDKGALFIDARVAAEYAEKHIRGAKSIPFKEAYTKESKTSTVDSFDVAKLPADKNKPLVFYCNGSPCWKGYKAAAVAIKHGYKQVYWFRDGAPAWISKGYPTE